MTWSYYYYLERWYYWNTVCYRLLHNTAFSTKVTYTYSSNSVHVSCFIGQQGSQLNICVEFTSHSQQPNGHALASLRASEVKCKQPALPFTFSRQSSSQKHTRGQICPVFLTKASVCFFLWMEQPWDFWEIGSHVYPQETDEITQEILTPAFRNFLMLSCSNLSLLYSANIMRSSNRQMIVCCAGRELCFWVPHVWFICHARIWQTSHCNNRAILYCVFVLYIKRWGKTPSDK